MARVTFSKLSDDDRTPFDGLQISSPAYPVPVTNQPPTQQPPVADEPLPYGLFDWSRIEQSANGANPRYTVALVPDRSTLDATSAIISRYATLDEAQRIADYLNAHPEPLQAFKYPPTPE